MKPMIAQCKAELLRTLRNRRFVIFSIVFPVMFYFIFTAAIGNNKQIGGVSWKAYYLMSMTVFGVVGSSMNTMAIRLSNERKMGWVRLIKITPLPSSAYVLSKIAAQAILNLGTILLMFIIGAAVKGVEMPVTEWLGSGLWIWLGAFPFMALGALLGTIRSPEVVQVLAQLIYMGMSFLGGLWTPTSAMSKLLQDIAKWLPTYRLGENAWNIISGAAFNWSGVAILAGYVLVFVGAASYILKKQEAV